VSRRQEVLEELGLTPLWIQRSQTAGLGVAASQQQPGASGAAPVVVTRKGGSGDESAWRTLRGEIAGCTRCVLHEKRKQAVPGVGDERAEWLFVGEGPGAEEDARGEPFVGQAGKLLDNMLASIGLARGNNVYIANVVKCRPPGNRTPLPEEAEACAPFLDRQIDLIQPRVIVALGKVSAQRLLGREGTLASMRKSVHDYRGIALIVTYHPAYLLRNLADKAKAWEDLCFAVDTMATLRDKGE